MRVAETEFVVYELVCVIRCAQFGAKQRFISARMRGRQSGQKILLPLPVKLWEATDKEEGGCCDYCGSETLMCRESWLPMRVQEVDRQDAPSLVWFPFEFSTGRAGAVTPLLVSYGKRKHNGDWHSTFVAEVNASYINGFSANSKSPRFPGWHTRGTYRKVWIRKRFSA